MVPITGALLFIVAALVIAYITLQVLGKKPTYQGSTAIFDLSKPGQVVAPTSDIPWTNEPCSVRFAIYVTQAPRTIGKVDCVDSTSSFAPSCSDYSFKKCECSSNDCTRCSLDTGYLSKLVSAGDSLQLWASGYTSQNDKPYVPAILKVRTASDSTHHYMESIELPAIPLQAWTVITIVKEGRRFDVYYGAKSVASKLCDKTPFPPGGSTNWTVGNPGWKGKIGLFAGMKKVQTSADVLADVQSLVNTRGVPFYLDQMKFDFNFTAPDCLFGNCNKLPDVKPANPFSTYITSVQ
jgi:hypothetical protein